MGKAVDTRSDSVGPGSIPRMAKIFLENISKNIQVFYVTLPGL